MVLISRLISRVLGPACILIVLGLSLAPMTAQRSVRMNVDPLQFADERLGSTLSLIVPAILFATVLWLPLAFLVAHRRGPIGLLLAPGTILAQALAPFLTGLMLLVVFAVNLRLFPVAGAGTAAQLVLPSVTLAIVLVGLLSHATYLRAVTRQAAETSGSPSTDASPLLGIADDWLDTLSRYAGAFVGAIVVVEMIFAVPGVGRLLVEAVSGRDQPTMAAAVYRLVTISAALTIVFGIGAAFTGRLLDRRRASALALAPRPEQPLATSGVWSPNQSRRLAVVALTLGGLLLFALLAIAVTPSADPIAQSMAARLVPPGQDGHVLGTDPFGRDLAARIAHGLLSSLLLAVPATLLASMVGIVLGLAAAAFRIGDLLVSALIDAVQAIPGLVFAIFVISAIGPGMVALSVVLPLVIVFIVARLTRDCARAAWADGPRRLRPAVGAAVLAVFVGLGNAVLLEATLSFLGLGALPPTPSIGQSLADGMRFLGNAPWLLFYPGLALTALVASTLLLGYGAFGLLRLDAASAGHAPKETMTPVPA